MKNIKLKLLVGALAGALAGIVGGTLFAQSVTQDNISGNECWNAGQGPGGPGSYLCSNTVRNSMAHVSGTISGSTTLGAGTLASLSDGGNVLITAQPVAVSTLIAPANPVPDGAFISMCNVTGSAFATTNIAMVANTGQTFNTAASLNNLGATTCITYEFNRATTTWYRTR